MAEKPADRRNAEATRKGIQKVNLEDLQGQINKRGRQAFHDEMLKTALADLFADSDPKSGVIWDDGFVDPNMNEKDQTKVQAKFRSRAVSVAKQINKDFAVTVQYLKDGRMLITKRNA